MDSEEINNLKIIKNEDLNEEAEYLGNKQDLEQVLLDAQRYLNIFHQIHIFNDRKKAEFEQSLIDMPDNIRTVLLNLPGGRVLIEHIEDCEIKRGLRKTRTIFTEGTPVVQLARANEEEEDEEESVGKEFARSMKEVMEAYNLNLLQINEKILQNTKKMSEEKNDVYKQNKILTEVLRENNKQQIDVLKTLGTTLSQAIVNSQRELAKKMISAKDNTSAPAKENSDSAPKTNKLQIPIENSKNVKTENTSVSNVQNKETPKKTVTPTAETKEIPAVKNDKKAETTDINDIKVFRKFGDSSKPAENKVSEINNNPAQATKPATMPTPAAKPAPVSAPAQKAQAQQTPVQQAPASAVSATPLSDIDISTFLEKDKGSDNILNAFTAQQPKEVKKETTPEAKPAEAPVNVAFNTLGSAMQKIKDAITDTAGKSFAKTQEAPISLNSSDDDLTASFSKAFASSSQEQQTPFAEKEWEYVDENGNPVNPDEWEYVDENGNPVNPDDWEYVDEDGNPVNPDEWEYVDENGNPLPNGGNA